MSNVFKSNVGRKKTDSHSNLVGESLHFHRSRRHLVVFFRQKLGDQSLDVEEQNVAVRVLRVGAEPVDDQRERATLLLNLERNNLI